MQLLPLAFRIASICFISFHFLPFPFLPFPFISFPSPSFHSLSFTHRAETELCQKIKNTKQKLRFSHTQPPTNQKKLDWQLMKKVPTYIPNLPT